MAKGFGLSIEFDGVDAYIQQIKKMEASTEGIVKAGIYDGAAIAVDAIKESIRQTVSPEATGDLENSVGLSKMSNRDGYIFTKIGYDGYDRKGVPNVVKARVLENGTSDKSHKATRFTSKALKKCKGAVETQIEVTINDRIKKIMK